MRPRAGLMIVGVLLLPVAELAQDKAPASLYPMPPPVSPPVSAGEGADVDAVRGALVDRAIRCLRYAASIGVPRERMDQYLRDCVLQ